jgi:AraC family transcriptional regulator, arabinose operon regulatory protein
MTIDGRVTWAIAEMQRRIGEEISVPALAAAVNLSRSRFAHLFKHETGVSPARYLRDQRLERARDLLESTFLSVKEVMAAVGFNDPSHFSRDFHRTFGASPRAWRKRAADASSGQRQASSANDLQSSSMVDTASHANEGVSPTKRP